MRTTINIALAAAVVLGSVSTASAANHTAPASDKYAASLREPESVVFDSSTVHLVWVTVGATTGLGQERES